MPIPGAGPVPPTPSQNLTTQQTTDAASPTKTPGAAFGQKMDAAKGAADAAATQAQQQVTAAQAPAKTDPLSAATSLRQEIAQIRADLEKQKVAGKIDEKDGQIQLWRLFDLQTRAQDLHFRVELVTKVVEHGTSSVKQISQTQA